MCVRVFCGCVRANSVNLSSGVRLRGCVFECARVCTWRACLNVRPLIRVRLCVCVRECVHGCVCAPERVCACTRICASMYRSVSITLLITTIAIGIAASPLLLAGIMGSGHGRLRSGAGGWLRHKNSSVPPRGTSSSFQSPTFKVWTKLLKFEELWKLNFKSLI